MPPVDPKELRQQADALEREARAKADAEVLQAHQRAEALRRAADVLDQPLQTVRQATAEIAEERRALTSDAESTHTAQPMSTPTISSAELARGMSRSRSKRHPFLRALYEAEDPKKRKTVTDWANAHGVPVPTVASWYSKGSNKRRIPMRWARVIEKELGLPATVETWRNGITE
jgi:hypothetical protein